MNRKELKQRGKAAFKANYWKSVLVAFLLTIAVGGFSVGNSANSVDTESVEELFDPGSTYSQDLAEATDLSSALNEQGIDADFSSLLGEQATVTAEETATPLLKDAGVLAGFGGISFLLSLFLLGPLEISCRNFFKKNLREPAELEALNAGFVPKYWHNLAVMLVRNIFQFLWTLLLIIPGLIMSYAYAMTPYLAADHPELGAKATIDLSRDMMKGHKWELFVLDLSFLGWILLSIITLGIVEVFYAGPYMASTHAAFYKELCGQTSAPTDVVEADLPAEA